MCVCVYIEREREAEREGEAGPATAEGGSRVGCMGQGAVFLGSVPTEMGFPPRCPPLDVCQSNFTY